MSSDFTKLKYCGQRREALLVRYEAMKDVLSLQPFQNFIPSKSMQSQKERELNFYLDLILGEMFSIFIIQINVLSI